jgi:hypothetical protein
LIFQRIVIRPIRLDLSRKGMTFLFDQPADIAFVRDREAAEDCRPLRNRRQE